MCTECIGNGVQEIGKCSSDAPIFASLPHFLNAEQKFLDAVDGLSPHNEKHDFTLNFEPVIYFHNINLKENLNKFFVFYYRIQVRR